MTAFDQLSQQLVEVSNKNIFFIVGVAKSGTTWLQNLLNGHPDINCQGESHLINHLLPAMMEVISQQNHIVRRKNKMLEQEENGYPIFKQQHAVHLARTAIYLMLHAQANGDDVKYIGEKTPDNINHMEQIVSHLIPQAKFIHIIRDGRDGAVSGWHHIFRDSPTWAKENFPRFSLYAQTFAEQWRKEIILAKQFEQKYPNHYFETRYELLHSQPEQAVQQLLAFLGADNGPTSVASCLQAGHFAQYSDGRAQGEENQLSHYRKGVVGDWQNTFDDHSTQLFHQIAGDLLSDLGYLLN